MTAILNPTCPLCGLRFDSRPLLDLHIREDHRARTRPAAGTAQVPPPRPAGTAQVPPPRPAGTAQVPPPRPASPAGSQPPAVRPMTRPRRLIRALRHIDDELMRAGEAIIRSARVPPPRRPDQATEIKNRNINERVGRAA